jgi:predicted ATPase
MKKGKNEELSLPSNANPIAKLVRSRTYRPKVIQSDKLYNRKRERKNTLNAAAKKYE